MPTQDELFAAVDALLAGEPEMPSPAERSRLREAAGVTQARLAQVLQTATQTVKNWENGRSEPRPPRREAYQRLLEGWAAQHPLPDEEAGNTATSEAAIGVAQQSPDHSAAAPEVPGIVTNDPRQPEGSTPAVSIATPAVPAATPAVAAPAVPVATPTVPVTTPVAPAATPATRRSTARRPAEEAEPKPHFDLRFPNGPLAVLDGDGTAHCIGGIMLDCPATTIPHLVDWALGESGTGAARLHRNGKDADPLVVLTESAAARFGLPPHLEDRRGLRLPEDHPVVKEIARAKWKLTRRGFGPWARIYRPAQGGERQCVQLAIVPWDALDPRAWGDAGEMAAPELARVLGVYAARVLTPRGSTAVTGLELMTALRPPTRAVKDTATGTWVSGRSPGSLGTEPVDPAPPEAPAEHPVAQGWNGGFLDEEACQWVRDPQLLSDEECLLPYAVGIDINTAFLAAAARLSVGLGRPRHVRQPVFDKKIPGSWFVDLSSVDVDPRLPSPFTPSGERPTGPGWYHTNTVAYAVELGYPAAPLEAFVRDETGAFLDPWHDRLKDAYVTTIADLGVPVGKDVDERAFLEAMERHKQVDPSLAHVLSAIKATVKGGIGKLRERPQGRQYRDGERWPALERSTWRPDIRAAVISKARVNMHRKMLNTAKATGLYPLAVLSDCVVYPSRGPSPLDFLPLTEEGRVLPGTFRLGATPGLAKFEGVREMAWAVDLMEQGYNPARHIKGGDAVLDGGE